MSDKYTQFRQYISGFISGPNASALIETLADQVQRQQDLSISVCDQLTICTASSNYLDKRLAEVGITRPPDLGMSDLAFRNLGIEINAQKKLSELVHSVLETFYGPNSVRAHITSSSAEPYALADGMDLVIQPEDGIERQMVFRSSDFNNINQATAAEVSDAITRFIRLQGLNGFAQTYTDLDSGNKYVRVYGGAKGPYSTIQIRGGEADVYLNFPTMRGTATANNNTAWQVTRPVGSTLRFRWIGNDKPNLAVIFPGDLVLLYGSGFKAEDALSGTFEVTNVRPATSAPDLNSGWFEITNINFNKLRSVQAGVLPPPNNPGAGIWYSLSIPTANATDLKFTRPVKALPNVQPRYALAWEPTGALLKIYMPATTDVVARGIIGAAHLHLARPSTEFNGAFGSTTDNDAKIEIINERAFKYKQQGLDNIGTGGTISYGVGPTIVGIDYIFRENGYTTVICTATHGLTGIADPFGRVLSASIVAVNVGLVPQDDPTLPFLGPYMVDPTANYTLESQYVTTREKIYSGSGLTTVYVDGILPNKPGMLLIDLNKNTQESPLKYIGVQTSGAPDPISLSSISQNGFIVTAQTTAPHGAIPGSQVLIAGTTSFNGTYTVQTVPSSTTWIAISTTFQVASEVAVGTSTVLAFNARSTLLLDPSFNFQHTHDIGADLTLMSAKVAYTPATDGTDYPFYITGVADGRVFAEEIIRQITALGINLKIIIVYPNDVGLGNEGGSDSYSNPPTSDKVFVWGI